MKTTLSIIIVSCILYSCGNTNENNETSSTADPIIENQVHADTAQTTTVSFADTNNVMTAPETKPAPVNVSPAPAMVTASGMNPPHGEPGHRCDISVGAPLNSAPTAKPAANPVITTSPTATPAVGSPDPASTTPVTTAPGMNPPHGEPGHDCKIAVGAPLKK